MNLEIKGFIETSFIDWDGRIVSVVFLPYCNFRCPFCHNADLVCNPQIHENVPILKIEGFLLKHKDFIDGICITGGEPAMHKDKGLFKFIKRMKELGFKIKLDTNGGDSNFTEKIISEDYIDYIAMDIKAPLEEEIYNKLSGIKVNLNEIEKSISLIMQGTKLYEFRVTVVPTLLNIKDIEAIAQSISGASKFVLQQFSTKNCLDKSLASLTPYSKEALEDMANNCKKIVTNTIIRGV